MELRQLWTVARRGWWLIALPLLVVAAYSAATVRPTPTAYALTLRFTAGQPQPPAESSGYDPNYYRWLTSEYIAGALKDWVRTGAFAQAVSADLAAQGVDLPAGAAAGAIAASDNARSLLTVTLSGPDPAALSALAGAVARVLQAENAQVFPQLGGQPATVTVLDSPAPAAQPAPLRAWLDVPVRLALALAAGLALAVAAFYFDPLVRDRRDLEQLGLVVVAELPRRATAAGRVLESRPGAPHDPA